MISFTVIYIFDGWTKVNHHDFESREIAEQWAELEAQRLNECGSECTVVINESSYFID